MGIRVRDAAVSFCGLSEAEDVFSLLPNRLCVIYRRGYEKAKSRYDELMEERSARMDKSKAIERYLSEPVNRDELLTEFDNKLWLTVVDYVEVSRDGTLVFHFFDGTKIMG